LFPAAHSLRYFNPKDKNIMKKILTIIGLAAATLTGAQATVLIQDSFPTNGDVVGTTPAVGGVWQNLSGTAGSLDVTGNRLQINPVSTEDAESDFAAASSLTLYSGFTFNLSAAALPTISGDYFAAFRDGSGYDGRIFAMAPTGTAVGKYRLGLSNSASTASVFWASDLDPGTDYRVVVRFTQNGATDFVSLWIDPVDDSSTSISTTAEALSATLTAFAFRQAGTAAGASSIDDLVVATTFAEAIPEPSTWALIGLGLGFALWTARRRRQVS